MTIKKLYVIVLIELALTIIALTIFTRAFT
jgi:hypothetical protein